MSSSRVDHGPFSDVLKDMLSKEFGHSNLVSNISNVSLCLTTLIIHFSSLFGNFYSKYWPWRPCHAVRSDIKTLACWFKKCNVHSRYMAEILPIRRKTLSNQSINQSIVMFTVNFKSFFKTFLRIEKNILIKTDFHLEII